MATFFGGEQLVEFKEFKDRKVSYSGGDFTIYTVPSNRYALVTIVNYSESQNNNFLELNFSSVPFNEVIPKNSSQVSYLVSSGDSIEYNSGAVGDFQYVILVKEFLKP